MAIPSRSSEKADFWRMVLDEHRKSSMTIKAFCAQQGVSEQSFYTWRRKLHRKDDSSSHEPTGLVPVTIVDQQRPAVHQSRPVQIVTPGGFVLRVDPTLPASTLTSLIHSIETAGAEAAR